MTSKRIKDKEEQPGEKRVKVIAPNDTVEGIFFY
jgi:hypothetical protein